MPKIISINQCKSLWVTFIVVLLLTITQLPISFTKKSYAEEPSTDSSTPPLTTLTESSPSPVETSPTEVPTLIESTPTPVPSPADVDNNGCVDMNDFSAWAIAFQLQTIVSGTHPDINQDGSIDILDFNRWYQTMQSGQNLCTP